KYIQSYLIDNNVSWLRLKFTQVYSTSFKDNNFKALQTFCTDILAKHPNLVFDSDNFSSVQENALNIFWEDICRIKNELEESDLPFIVELIISTILPARKKTSVQLPVREVHFVNPSSIVNDEHVAEISSWIDRCSSIYDLFTLFASEHEYNRSFTVVFKLEVISYAEETSNCKASLFYKVDRRQQVQVLEDHSKKAAYPILEKELVEFIKKGKKKA
ncbi:16709_t:CDS:2, partial [Gigaspora rosea]